MIAAYAVALTPALKWAFVLIAMLPVSLYNRSVLSADRAALSSALVVTALCFSAIQRYGGIWERSLWMTVCTLTKQPQIVFVLLELMAHRVVGLRRCWSNLGLVDGSTSCTVEGRRAASCSIWIRASARPMASRR
jgi:hypothetical protein